MIFNGSIGWLSNVRFYTYYRWKCGQFTLDVCRKLIGQLVQLGKHRDIGFIYFCIIIIRKR